MTPDQLVERFFQVFRGRADVFADGYPKKGEPNKYSYSLVEQPLTQQVIADHLAGKRQLGVYPITNNHVYWAAIDFDCPKVKTETAPGVYEKIPVENGFEIAWTEASQQAERFEQAGFNVYLERSRSGNGVHLWMFFEEPLPAVVVRRALKPHILPSVTFDRIFPLQDAVDETKGEKGNLIALPFNGRALSQGNGVMLDRETRAVLTPEQFFADLRPNYRAVVEELASRAPKDPKAPRVLADGSVILPTAAEFDAEFAGRPDKPMVGWLKLKSAYGCKFIQHCWKNRATLGEHEWYAMIQQASCFAQGLEIAHAMSKDYLGYSESETTAKYEHACANVPVGCAYIKEHFPALACNGCGTAPYRVAEKPIITLVQDSQSSTKRGGFVKYLEHVQRRQTGEETSGTPFAIPGMERYTRHRASELTIIGAGPSIGKTAVMVDLMINLAESNRPVVAFSAETSESPLMDRLLARVSAVDSRAIRGERVHRDTGLLYPLTPDEYAKVEAAAAHLDTLPIYLNYTAINADQILKLVEETLLTHAIPFDAPYVVLFDYLQFGAKVGDESNYDRVSRLSAEFKNVAKITEHAVVVFSQLIRAAAEGDGDPTLTWFRDSGRIEADLDVGIIITGERMAGTKAPRRMTIVKQREGESQITVDYVLHQAINKFEPVVVAQAATGADLLDDDRPNLFGEPEE